MRLLLDTHVVIRWLAALDMDDNARAAIGDPANAVFVSAVSAWEISIKKSLEKLDAPDDLEHQLERHGFEPLFITVRHGIDAGALPRHHSDPFDRMLIAQARADGFTLVTRDSVFTTYDVPLLPA